MAARWPGSREACKRSGRIEAHADFLLALVEDRGDPTLAEIQACLAGCGTRVGMGTLHRFFDRHRITCKEKAAPKQQERADVLSRREAWFNSQLDLDPEHLVFIV